MERALTPSSVEELIRLLQSDAFSELRCEHIRTVGEYGAIELGGERFFERAFSTGKEAASSLALAHHLGPDAVLGDLLALRASLTGRAA